MAVESQEPLSRVPNLPDDNVQTAGRRAEGSTWFLRRRDGQRRKRLTGVFVALQGVQRLRLIQGENTDVAVVSARRDEPSGVFVSGCNHADAGHKVGVSGHAVHL